MSHINNGACQKCIEIIDAYPGFDLDLRNWFMTFQKLHPEMHTSCAGRGKVDQEALFLRRATRAHWGQSSHNWNAALDLFVVDQDYNSIYPVDWFNNTLGPSLPDWIKWYGRPGSAFFELPHIEKSNWDLLSKTGGLELVEQA